MNRVSLTFFPLSFDISLPSPCGEMDLFPIEHETSCFFNLTLYHFWVKPQAQESSVLETQASIIYIATQLHIWQKLSSDDDWECRKESHKNLYQ